MASSLGPSRSASASSASGWRSARAGSTSSAWSAQGGKLIAIGSALGLAGAAAIGRVLASQIRTVSALDPAVLAAAVLALGVAALFASWLPARRAGATDPMVALRAE